MKKTRKDKVYISKRILIKKYIREEKSNKEVAKELNLSGYIVWARLKEYGLMRNQSEATIIAHKKVIRHKLNCQCCVCKSKRGELEGKNHYLYGRKGIQTNGWIDGRSFEPYPLEWTETLKEAIRQRDNYICQNKNCGCLEIELYGRFKKLDVHHIDYNKENLDPNNLISLCHDCHMKTNGNRDYWINYFQAKMEVRNET